MNVALEHELHDLLAAAAFCIEGLHILAYGKNLKDEPTILDRSFYIEVDQAADIAARLNQLFDRVDVAVAQGDPITFTK